MQKDKTMKKLLLLLTCLTVLVACKEKKSTISLGAEDPSNKKSTFSEPKSTISLSAEDKSVAIETLQLYQNVDSQLMAERNELYLLIYKHSEPADEVSEEDKGYFLRNIAHIDSIVTVGTELINQNKGDELLSLLETELFNFYAHPHNTVDNEIALHQLVVELYRRQPTSKEEFLAKVIPLSEWTVMHIEALEHKHPVYPIVLTELIVFCSSLEDYGKAILNGEKLSAYAIQIDDKETQIYSSLLLSRAYNKIGQQEQKDSCINSVSHLPQFNEISEAVKDMLN